MEENETIELKDTFINSLRKKDVDTETLSNIDKEFLNIFSNSNNTSNEIDNLIAEQNEYLISIFGKNEINSIFICQTMLSSLTDMASNDFDICMRLIENMDMFKLALMKIALTHKFKEKL